MKTFVAVLLLSGILLSIGISEIRANQVWSPCGGHRNCQKSCDQPSHIPCPIICIGGNVCENGYVRQSNAEDAACIPQDDCPLNSRIFE